MEPFSLPFDATTESWILLYSSKNRPPIKLKYPNESWDIMGTSTRPYRDPHRISRLKRNIFQGKSDAEHFHTLALQCRREGKEALAEKALSAEKACRENVSALQKELEEHS